MPMPPAFVRLYSVVAMFQLLLQHPESQRLASVSINVGDAGVVTTEVKVHPEDAAPCEPAKLAESLTLGSSIPQSLMQCWLRQSEAPAKKKRKRGD